MKAILLALLVVIILVSAAVADEDGFKPLFDGKTLKGWINVNGPPENWTVKDGMIHLEGIPTGAMRTVRQYENFILELEWRHLKSGGNSGVFIWASPLPPVGVPFLRGIEVQVLDHGYGKSDWFTTHGDVFPIHGSTMKPFAPNHGMRSFPNENRSKGTPEWNHYRVTCNAGEIHLGVNGKDVSGGTDCQWRKGYLALESEGAPVDFRNIRIKELPSTNATAEQSAPQAETFITLYDGRSLHGWKIAVDQQAHWKPGDWVLHADGQPDGATLWADRNAGDFELICDWQWAAAPIEKIPPVTFRPVKAAGKEIGLPALEAANPTGWNRLQLARHGTHLKISVNGKPAMEMEVPNGKLVPGLQPHGQPTQFANIFLK